jgi:hypothetical protein
VAKRSHAGFVCVISPCCLAVVDATEARRISTTASPSLSSPVLKGLVCTQTKLRCLIDELNDNYDRRYTYAGHALLRTLLDHLPPLLGCRDFQQLVNNYPWSRSDASYARKLEAFKLQANDALHRPISPKADLLAADDMPLRIWIDRLLQECASPAARVEKRNVGESRPRTTGQTAANQRSRPSAGEGRKPTG